MSPIVKIISYFIIALWLGSSFAAHSQADSLQQAGIGTKDAPLQIQLVEYDNGGHRYFHELISRSLEHIGVSSVIRTLPQMPQPRLERMLESGAVTVHWFFPNAERESRYLKIPVDITGGLAGRRVFFIPSGTQHLFDNIRNLEDFRSRNLVGGFGAGWYDIEVWRQNTLEFRVIPGDPLDIFRMLESGNRGIDYFSRSVLEIIAEIPRYPGLEIEQHLLFSYPRDFMFFVSANEPLVHEVLSFALSSAQEDGILEEIRSVYLPPVYQILNLDDRVNIQLDLPPEG
ncbi:hypothetical protein [Salinispira pacifica]|uniref:hypothetical protein n=1 Tax=Salinispira pacifica TaxID=1307761 RepID=UPI000428D303|nr:hypothetical protein [Salinispira pacifica]